MRNPPDPDRPQQTPLFKSSKEQEQEEKKLFHVHWSSNNLLVVDNGGLETLGLLDVDGLDVGVELLLGALLVVTLTGDADTETEGNTLDTALPDLLVELGVETDVLGALDRVRRLIIGLATEDREEKLTMECSAKLRISLIARGARFLKVTPWHYKSQKKRNQSSARMP